MKKIFCLLSCVLLVFSLSFAQEERLSPAEMRQEQKMARQEAELWVKDEITLRKKVIAQLRKIKDERSAQKASASICKLLKNDVGAQTAMGEVGVAQRPTGDAIVAEDKKREPIVAKQKKQIAAELKRIEDLELSVPEWITAQTLVEKMP